MRRYAYKNFTDEDKQTMRAMKTEGATLDAIAERFNCNPETVKRVIIPGFAEMRAAQIAKARALRSARKSTPVRQPAHIEFVPSHVLRERDVRMSQPISLTTLIMGDPRPGQSALDKQRSGWQSLGDISQRVVRKLEGAT